MYNQPGVHSVHSRGVHVIISPSFCITAASLQHYVYYRCIYIWISYYSAVVWTNIIGGDKLAWLGLPKEKLHNF